jgi:hypothetical protein
MPHVVAHGAGVTNPVFSYGPGGHIQIRQELKDVNTALVNRGSNGSFNEKCYVCGKEGHRAADCRRRSGNDGNYNIRGTNPGVSVHPAHQNGYRGNNSGGNRVRNNRASANVVDVDTADDDRCEFNTLSIS